MNAEDLDMPGRQLASFWEGNRAELFATYALSGVAAVVSVPHQFDVGVDLLCTLMRRVGNALYAGRSFGIQVRLGATEFRYGGLSNRGEWMKHELKWLYELQDAPLLLGVVDLRRLRVRLYSPTRMWWVLTKNFWPCELVLVPDLEPQADGPRDFAREQLRASDDGAYGDGYRYHVPLGKPIVEVALDQEETPERKEQIRACLDSWVELELRNIRHYKLHIPYTEEWTDWTTNEVPSKIKQWHYVSNIQDQHVRQILKAISPAIASLHHQFRRQEQDAKIHQVLPMCELLREYGFLDPSLGLPEAQPNLGAD